VRTVVRLVKGDVLVKLPASSGTTGFVALDGVASIPVGSIVDARHGTLNIRSAGRGGRASATARAGIFRIRQSRARGRRVTPTDLELVSAPGAQARCASRGAAAPRKGVVRGLSVVAKGIFRTVAGAAIASARDASWSTTDRCDGTLTRVAKGRVAVRATHGRIAQTVRAGHSLLIRARLFASRRQRQS
jgi:hypothetical protein